MLHQHNITREQNRSQAEEVGGGWHVYRSGDVSAEAKKSTE